MKRGYFIFLLWLLLGHMAFGQVSLGYKRIGQGAEDEYAGNYGSAANLYLMAIEIFKRASEYELAKQAEELFSRADYFARKQEAEEFGYPAPPHDSRYEGGGSGSSGGGSSVAPPPPEEDVVHEDSST